MIHIDIRINDRLTTIRRKDGGKRLTAHLAGLDVKDVPEFPLISVGVSDALVCAFVRMGAAGRGIQNIPETRLEQIVAEPLMLGCPVVMGMTAFNTFGYRIRKQALFVATKDPMSASFMSEGDVSFYRSPTLALEAAIKHAQETGIGPVWVRGGASVYEALWPYIDHLFALKTRGTFPGELMFPATPLTEWSSLITAQLRTPLGEDHKFTATVMKRKAL